MPAAQTRKAAQQQEAPEPRAPRALPEAPAGGFPGYTAAMAWVQEHLPRVDAVHSASIKSDRGAYSYTYADLADVSYAVLPLLGRAGLVWTCLPTVFERGMILKYELRHVSGEHVSGEWPISGGTPQALGSAITYGRRYALMAVVGVFPGGEDDDGALATQQAQRSADRPAQRRQEQDRQAEQPQDPPGPPDVDSFVRAVSEAIEAGSLQALENLRDSAARRFRLEKTTEVPDPATGEQVGALELLRRAAAAVRANTAPAPESKRQRITAPPEQVQATLDQWSTPAPADAAADTTSSTEGQA